MNSILRRVLVLTVVLGVCMSGSFALAAAPTVTYYMPRNASWNNPQIIFDITYQGSNYDWGLMREEGGVEEPVDASGSWLPAPTGTDESGSVTVYWDYLFDGDFTPDDIGSPHRLIVSTGGTVTTIVDFLVNWLAYEGYDQVTFVSMTNYSLRTWYSNNTVCSFGPAFRDISPGLTDKWYQFTPVDLSVDGTQTFDLIGGSVYVIGKVTVAVEGDSVRVDYHYANNHVEGLKEFFTLFPDYDSITTVNPDEIDSPFVFGQTYSISEDLNNDTDMLLFICNRATFSDDAPGIVRFWPNLDWRIALRDAMLAHIGK